jgi:hypothetical protein
LARTKGKPGPKPAFEGSGVEYHIKLPSEAQANNVLSEAEAFEKVAGRHGGIIRYVRKLVLSDPEFQKVLREGE